MSYKSKTVVQSIVCELGKKFGKISSLYYGPECDFIGMKFKFEKRKVSVDMREHLRKTIYIFGETNLKPVMLPAKNGLHHIDPDWPKVSETK